jgi:hypothetical protein
MKGRKTRATGGVNEAAEDLGRKNLRYTYQSNVNDEAEKRKSGGKVRGMAAKMHAGRKPRKSGGSCDSGNPFSSARHGTAAKGRKLEMEME